MLLDDVASGRLKPTAVVLLMHYKRVAWTLHGGPVIESLRDTQKATGLSQGTILAARKALATTGWAMVDDGPRVATVGLAERWVENCPGHAAANAQNLSKPAADAQNLSVDAQKPGKFAQNLSEFARNLSNSELEIEDKTLKDVEEVGAFKAPTHPVGVGAQGAHSGADPDVVLELVRQQGLVVGLSPGDKKILRECDFTTEQIAEGWAAALKGTWTKWKTRAVVFRFVLADLSEYFAEKTARDKRPKSELEVFGTRRAS